MKATAMHPPTEHISQDYILAKFLASSAMFFLALTPITLLTLNHFPCQDQCQRDCRVHDTDITNISIVQVWSGKQIKISDMVHNMAVECIWLV